MFQHISPSKLDIIANTLTLINIAWNNYLYKRNEELNGIYLVKEGEFWELITFKCKYDKSIKMPLIGKLTKRRGSFEPMEEWWNSVSRNKKFIKQIELSVKGVYSVIGIEDYINNT